MRGFSQITAEAKSFQILKGDVLIEANLRITRLLSYVKPISLSALQNCRPPCIYIGLMRVLWLFCKFCMNIGLCDKCHKDEEVDGFLPRKASEVAKAFPIPYHPWRRANSSIGNQLW